MEDLESETASGTSTLPRQIVEEIAEFRGKIDDYVSGLLAPEDFKKCRLQLGIYGIRGLKDKQMVRVKVPAGQLTAEQVERLADLAEAFATGRGHVTTRQDVQLYEVPVRRLPEVLAALAAVGLTSREACGNSVRNITCCPLAGLEAGELFDVRPYALAITAYFLRNPVSQALPRKFKISVSGCVHDCAMAPIHDIGVVAATVEQDGHIAGGFTLHVGGGLGAVPKPAHVLEPVTPIGHLLPTCEAIIRVFDQHGERKDKSRARLKFLIERIGFPEFQRLVFAERQALLQDAARFPALPTPQLIQAAEANHPPLMLDSSPAFRRWLETNVERQRQPGYAVATVRLLLGDLSVRQMRALAGVARRFARGRIITTPWQDVCLPWVRLEDLPALFEALTAIGLALPDAQRIQDITSCPGADTCQIGITSSRGLSRALTELLDQPAYRTDDLRGLRIKISGCPNSCGQHHIADIGLFGGARNVHGQLVPHYQLLVGGGFNGAVRFGRPVAKIPARQAPRAVEALLRLYRRERYEGEAFHLFVERVGLPALQQAVQPFTVVPPPAESPEASYDWGQTTPFTLVGVGQGECAG